ncbi:MAG: BBP7 family outer membrane beta-barrel protein [Planctomycetia bacterium]|nr:BBP7 family outer membrane beta-barrel protein [Planctomycetia bacterium]
MEIPAANFLTIPGYPNFGSATFTSIRQVYGAELNALWSVREGNGQSWQLLGGYRYLNLNEELALATSQRDDVFFFPGQFVNTIDQFQTRNDFHGGQLGIRGQWTSGAWFFGSTLKLALGSTHEVVDIRGATTTNSGPFLISEIPVTTVPGGIYTQPTNIGTYQRDRFALLPEVSLRLGVQITSHVRIFTGYDFLYLSNVVRPGNQMDSAINPFQLVSFTGLPRPPLLGDPRPEPRFQTTDFWAQGLMLGAEIVW